MAGHLGSNGRSYVVLLVPFFAIYAQEFCNTRHSQERRAVRRRCHKALHETIERPLALLQECRAEATAGEPRLAR